jgi:hypothetical protein
MLNERLVGALADKSRLRVTVGLRGIELRLDMR